MTVLKISNLNVWFGEKQILSDVSHEFDERSITGIIGPSGSGKTTFIRCLNRLNDSISGYRFTGEITLDGRSIYDRELPAHVLRQQIGIIFQAPCVFPKSVYENMTFGLKNLGTKKKEEYPEIVENSLKSAHLWKEVKDRLDEDARDLSLGQQQRLCIARALTIEPKILMMDEPTSALDPKSTKAIEKLILELKRKITLVVVTHNIEQARRIADSVIFICDGKIIEKGKKEKFFTSPEKSETKEYLKIDEM